MFSVLNEAKGVVITMEKRSLTCIGCPLGCTVTVELDDGEIINVTGNTCNRGDDYARKEVIRPMRVVTGTVRVTGGDLPMVSVKTEHDIPKEKIMDIMKNLADINIPAPVHIGDVILEDAAQTGVNIVATKEVKIRT